MSTTAPISPIRQYFEDVAPNLSRWNRKNRFFYRDLEYLHQFFIPPQSRVLELGCGLGDLLHALNPAVGVGIDFAQPIVDLAAAQYPQLHFYCLDAEQLEPSQLASGHQTFDYIILSNVIGHLQDIQTVLQRLHPFCHRSTHVILSFHNHLWQPILNLAEAIGERRPQPPHSWLSLDDVSNLLTITGYQINQRGRRFLCPKPVPIVAGLCNRYLRALPVLEHFCLTNYIIARSQLVQPANPLPSCSVVVPARNEAGNIAATIDRLPVLGSLTEVIFVEGNSQDHTWAEIQRVVDAYEGPHRVKALQQTGRGKADAVHLGFAAATGEILMILDADLTVQPEDLEHFYEVIASDRGEFINGSRLIYPCSDQAMPWINMLANKFFSLVFSFLLSIPLKDTLCGTKVIWKQDYEKLKSQKDYFGNFDPFGDFELLFGAAKLGLRIVEVPVRYQPRSYGQSNIAHVKEGLKLLNMCFYASRKIKFF
ncbi:MAG: glycosyltransferase [Prochlorothrix sp.]